MANMQQCIEKKDAEINSLKEEVRLLKDEVEGLKCDSSKFLGLMEEKHSLENKLACVEAKDSALTVALHKISAMSKGV